MGRVLHHGIDVRYIRCGADVHSRVSRSGLWDAVYDVCKRFPITPMQRSRSGSAAVVDTDETKPSILDRVPRSVEPLIGYYADGIGARDVALNAFRGDGQASLGYKWWIDRSFSCLGSARHLQEKEANLVADECEPVWVATLALTDSIPCLRTHRPVSFKAHPDPLPWTGPEQIESTHVNARPKAPGYQGTCSPSWRIPSDSPDQ